jgi:hypothetical protein
MHVDGKFRHLTTVYNRAIWGTDCETTHLVFKVSIPVRTSVSTVGNLFFGKWIYWHTFEIFDVLLISGHISPI